MQKLGNLILKLMRWKIVGQLPDDKKYLLIVAPHTSNWDFIIGLMARFSLGIRINFIAKHQLFFFPLGNFLKAVGGESINRTKKSNTVEHTVELFRSRDEFRLAITPEGTRSPVTRWKEGFYHIATQAGVPIVMVGLDYQTKELRIEKPFWPSGDIKADFQKIIDYYRTIHGRFPKNIPDYQPKESV